MNAIELAEESARIVNKSEGILETYNNFVQVYTSRNNIYFQEELNKVGYNDSDISSILINKDALLSLFLNRFEVIEPDDDVSKIDINLQIEDARKKYIDSVDFANESIKAADEAKKIMLTTKSIIEAENGLDSSSWSNKNVRNLNKAILFYNELVERANNAVANVKVAREELAIARSSSLN